MPLPKPCLDCGTLTTNQSRCGVCQQKRDASPSQQQRKLARRMKKAMLYDSMYQHRAKLIRDSAVECYLCLNPFTQVDPPEADHLYPALGSSSPLLPAHRTCNNRKGNKSVDQLSPLDWPGLDRALKMFPPSRYV